MLGFGYEWNLMEKKFTRRDFTQNECMKIFLQYDKSIYDYYFNNAWCFGADARRYAEYLYRKHYLLDKFAEYHKKFEKIGETDTFRVFTSDGSFSSVRITNNQIELDGRITDESDFEEWLGRC